MVFSLEDLARILIAVLVGGLIGAEREYHDKAAGFRTIILICVGSALFTMFSIQIGGPEDPARIAAQIVSGVGFLGAGAILRDAGRVVGLTTAATIWLAAALGLGIGGGHIALVLAATGVILVVLWGFPLLEHWIDRLRQAQTYEVIAPFSAETLAELEEIFQGSGLRLLGHKCIKSGADMTCIWQTSGPPARHEQVIRRLFAMPAVREVKY